MASEQVLEEMAQEALEFAENSFNDTEKLTVAQSAQLWRGLASECLTWARTLETDMQETEDAPIEEDVEV